ncbi:MAG: hypothetical protein RMI94_13100 [Bryobacterales bacterium]|nr:hypothetical protein [Bryobacterales bacterium]
MRAESRLERLCRFLPFLGAGLAVVAVLVATIVWMQGGAHLRLEGKIGRVRTLALPDASSLLVVDFRVRNEADYPFVVRQVQIFVQTEEGETLEGAVASEIDTSALFQYYPILGPRYNPTLVARTKIEPRQSLDRMLAARFEAEEGRLQSRRGLRIRIEELDGAVSEIVEQRP